MIKDELTYKIIGCAMKVHSVLGNGFQEIIYQRAMSLEMEDQGSSFVRELETEIFYKSTPIGTRRVDFFIESRIMLEIKALIELQEVHLAQAMNYYQVYNLPLGLLINFGSRSLDFKRVYNVNHSENISSVKRIRNSTNTTNLNSDKSVNE